MIENWIRFREKFTYFFLVLIYVMTSIAGFFGIDADTTKIKLDKISVEQEITGWGTSGCWWAQKLGECESAEEVTKMLFSKEGLGLNIYRYNIGGGSKDDPTGRLDKNSSRATESFLVWDEEKEDWVYDWSKDAAAQKILDMVLDYGCVDTVVMFANSPHYSMCVSGNASGGLEDNQSNLKKECYQDYVDYFLDITQHFIDMGVPVKYISPINEPQWSWGGGWVGQEGCHYEIDEAVEVIRLFAIAIKERGMDVKISALESGQVGDHAIECLEKLYADEEIRSVLGTYAYHSYWTDRDVLHKASFGAYIDKNFPSLELEMSEWCELPNAHKYDDIEAGLIMARTIGEDISLTGVNSWSTWVAVNEGGDDADSMIAVDWWDYNNYRISKRYYAMAHYTKFIPVGSHAIDFNISVADITAAEDDRWPFWVNDKAYQNYTIENYMTVSAYKTPDKKYVVVIVNEGEEKDVSFNMLGWDAAVYTTDADSDLELTSETKGHKKITIGANSITTVVFER
jgi:O-glycosyl hydrolase